MASNTEHLGLLMKDPVADMNDTFNIETMLNGNWRKIDIGLGLLASCRDELAKLAPAHIYMEYWWKRRKAAQTFAPSVGDEIMLTSHSSRTSGNCIVYAGVSINSAGYTIQYSDTIAHDTQGNVVLVNPAETTVFLRDQDGNDTDPETWAFLRGKYVRNNFERILYIPADAEFYICTHPTPYYMCAITVCLVTPNVPPRVWENIHSADRSAFPDTGVEGEWEYRYVGIPMDEVVGGLAPHAAFSVHGSYVGDGEAKKSLDFPFEPKLVVLQSTSSGGDICVCVRGATKTADGAAYGGSGNDLWMTWEGNVWATTDGAYNRAGVTYYYTAIG